MKNFNFILDIVKTLKSVKTGDRVVVGYASTFDVDTDNAQITREALENAKDDLLEYSTVLFNHDMNQPIGKVIETEVDDIGLLVKVILSKNEDDIWKKIEEGIINKFSIKGRALDIQPLGGDVQQVNKIKLYEVSLVSVPANVEAQTISHWIAKTLSETETSDNVIKINMKELIEKLKVILSKDNLEEVKKDLEEIVKDSTKEDELIGKLQVVAGKLSGDDKIIVEQVIELLKVKPYYGYPSKDYYEYPGYYYYAYPTKAETDEEKKKKKPYKPYYPEKYPAPNKKLDFADESEIRPVFQLNERIDATELEEGSKFRKHLLKLGKWFHWDADGGILNITEDVIDNIVNNFKKHVIEHVFIPLTHTSDPSLNAGEILKLEKTENGLDAIIEIKDETIAEKIKKGLIKCISASLDPNYRVKTTNKFVGPTLLHAALVSEPFIKGMRSFVPLSEEFSGRSIIQLEDEEPNFYSIMKALKDIFEESGKSSVTPEMFAEEFAKLRNDLGLSKQIEDEVKKEETEEVVEEKIEDKKEEAAETPEEIEKKKVNLPKEGEACKIGDKEGKWVKEGDQMVCKAFTDEEIKVMQKAKFQDCMSREMKAGKTMAEAAKICKAEANKLFEKTITEEPSGEKPEGKSEEAAQQLDFAEAERIYEGYLVEGKIIPAQKDAFVKLMTTRKKVELGDDQVDVSELLKTFMKSQVPVINFDEDGVVVSEGDKKDEKKENLADIPSDVKEFYGKMGIRTDEGIKKSWDNLQELKREAEDNKSTLF